MKFKVNENCIGCGLCTEICPEVFSLTGEGVATAQKEDVSSELEDSAMEALSSCPVDAIENDD